MVMNLSIDTKELDFPAGYQALYSCMLIDIYKTHAKKKLLFLLLSFKLLCVVVCLLWPIHQSCFGVVALFSSSTWFPFHYEHCLIQSISFVAPF